jgi:ferrous iron transport protein B
MKIGLIGNPNVGKSLIFQQLTGLGVEISNYPGTTVDIKYGSVCYEKERLQVVDLPGIYSLDGDSDEERMVRSFLQSGEVDCLIAVVDATHLERNLYLLIQVAEYGIPTLIVLNMTDEAEKKGLNINPVELGALLGIEVIPTAAIQGKNVDQIIPSAIAKARVPHIEVHYDTHIEAAVRSLQSLHSIDRHGALMALQGTGTDEALLESAGVLSAEIEQRHRMTVHQIIAGNRHHCAASLVRQVEKKKPPVPRFDPDRILSTTWPGLPVLVGILILILITVFFIGSWLEGLIVQAFNLYAIQPLLSLSLPPLAEELALSFILALQAGLGIAFPFIFTFYIFISILEDTGYLTRAAFLADRGMHRVGMHGVGIIPMVLGLGCNVPAIMSIRLLGSRRERVIASFLVTMIPCSARTVIIAGILASFVSILSALSVYLFVFVLIIITGVFLSRITPGEQFGMILEMAPLRTPRGVFVLKKSWSKIREFLFIAMPLLLAASIVLGLLQYYGVFDLFEQIIEPFSMAVLGLPAYAVTALIFGILRKEMALETLVILAGNADLSAVLTAGQLYTFAIVSVLFVPCISTIAVLSREVGTKIAFLVSLYTLTLGIFIGALINVLIVWCVGNV